MRSSRLSVVPFLFCVLALSLAPVAAWGNLQLPAIFGDNMVLQRDMKVPVWGLAGPGETVTVAIAGQKVSAVADANGEWRAELAPLKSGGGPLELAISAPSGSITFKNVLAGEVWLASGQSNMELMVVRTNDANEEIASANNPEIRMITIPHKGKQAPQWDFADMKQVADPNDKNNKISVRESIPWQMTEPNTVGGFSAVAYYFAKKLHKDLGVPVGIINASWGGTPIELFMDPQILRTAPEAQPIRDYWDAYRLKYPGLVTQYEADLAQWNRIAPPAVAAALEAKAATDGNLVKPVAPEDANQNVLYEHQVKIWVAATRPAANKALDNLARADANFRQPRMPTDPNRVSEGFGSIYYGELNPIHTFAIRGAIWYQGEANAGRAYFYRKLFPEMIRQWRQVWGEGDFPFLFVQLVNWKVPNEDPNASSEWAELREAQAMTLSVPKTAMAVGIDIGETADIHPKNKQEVGRRLALGALAVAYGKEVAYLGPTYDSMTVEGSSVRVKFKNAGRGLTTGLLPSTQPAPATRPASAALLGFAVAGEDRKFYWAQATIDGSSVVVTCPQVPKPVAVRYAWTDNPQCNLYNSDALPASPFRTDTWPGATADK